MSLSNVILDFVKKKLSWFSRVIQWEVDAPCASKLVQPCVVVHKGLVNFLFPFISFH
jgi:hypothetical protein